MRVIELWGGENIGLSVNGGWLEDGDVIEVDRWMDKKSQSNDFLCGMNMMISMRIVID